MTKSLLFRKQALLYGLLPEVARRVAELKGLPLKEVARAATENAVALF